MTILDGVARLLLPIAGMLIAGCSDPRLGELDRQLAALRNDPGPLPSLELPGIPDHDVVNYLPSESRSPFQPRELDAPREVPADSLVMPRVDRQREPLEAYALSELDLVGTLTVGSQPSALVKEPGGQVHRLRIGNYLGLNHGRIVSITSSSILLVELVVEQGAWVERNRQLTLDS